ncbi:16S rRNA processing protein RimM [Paenibacillus jamilae]|jgi:16S rRNA processing protein RimM|uniref:ribosome maturation factor RimM n=1 Tax=Paenibacillus polymyxa TaxID=1406 RepID=UPI000D315A60|nr:ribosome maturation factor RimM [Paenibacillus polymyxa]MDP9676915.1 16S rRNA processing protein RimM [Paenibacillus jamilae]MBY0021550.1 ribosome maturation factor RimM [Paenibacillus polymyxa]MBY0055573.1 ribosome maturation factor RimM [Paenibacillus polymyxa]MBY0072513.1 ribosome maturation factor RimM [Paenibacillus polymyxa]MBY0081583.1 ribosome maturation factor RimM [Paenibacillus polymyxa]
MQQMFNVGKIVNTHGIRGELKILTTTDFLEDRFAKGSELMIFPADDKAPIPVTVETARFQKNMVIVKFKEYHNINDVEKYKGTLLKVSAERLGELEENEFYFHEVVGMEVVTEDGTDLGVVKEILTPGANDVWVVQMPKGKELLLPYIEDVILDVNVREKRVTVRLMEGLL